MQNKETVSTQKSCEGCPIRAKVPNAPFVKPQTGNRTRVIIGNKPEPDDSVTGKQYSGSGGKVLDSLLRKASINRDSLSIVNVINCGTPNNSFPTDVAAKSFLTDAEGKAAVAHCWKAYAQPLYQISTVKRIDAIGDKALLQLTGEAGGLDKWRGSPLKAIGETKERVMPTLDPTTLMRQQDMIPTVLSDLKKGLMIPPEYYNLTPSPEDLEAFENAEILTFDIETNRWQGNITMIGVAVKPYHVLVAPYQGRYIPALKKVIASAKVLVGQNHIGFDIPKLKENGFTFREDVELRDIMLIQHLLQPGQPHGLEFISSVFTQKPAWKHLASDNMALYCARDVDVTVQAYSQLWPLLKSQGMLDLYKYTQVPLAMICKQMSDTGIRTDPSRLTLIREKVSKELEEAENILPPEMRTHEVEIKKRVKAPTGTLGKSGKPVKYIHIPGTEEVTPWQSPKSVEGWLYTTLGLPKQTHPKTKKVSTDKMALERLQRQLLTKGDTKTASWVKALGDVRKLDELMSTFLKADGAVASGKVHSSFLVHGTNTGRLSSSGPNMQNVTKKAKYLYVPNHADWCFVEMDFSSLENRLAAWYANDTDRLARMAQPDFNEHKWLASKIYNIPETDIDKDSEEYSRAKHTNHGADAGMGPRKMSLQYNVPEKDCKHLLLMWKQLNHKSATWQEQTGNKASKDGVLTTNFGRKNWFWTHGAYTEGIRFILQSSGADICYRTMIALCYEQINWNPSDVLKVSSVLAPLPKMAQLVCQVHDSLLFQCPQSEVENVVKCLKQAATQKWPQLGDYSIPIAIKVGNPGDSWAELAPYKEAVNV